MLKHEGRNKARRKRHRRLRTRISGTANSPRLNVFRSLQHIYAQVIDDGRGVTLAAASSLDPEIRTAVAGQDGGGGKVATAQRVGELIARRARERGVSRVVFDRGGYRYHGRVQAMADAARSAGLEF
ncbi:MAG TPA: 50S ribosomal protein L18 [Clostridiales bacterium]|nr:50S ribosomal protein L18 [Clostridiales bacterium]